MKRLAVNTLPIRLGQLLKVADLVQDGFEAKLRIQSGEVLVNGVVETRRGRQLVENDIVVFESQTYLVSQ